VVIEELRTPKAIAPVRAGEPVCGPMGAAGSTDFFGGACPAAAPLCVAPAPPCRRDAASARDAWGLLMCLGGSLSDAGVTLIAELARDVGSFALAWWQCAVGVMALAAWPLNDGWPAWGAAWGWLAGRDPQRPRRRGAPTRHGAPGALAAARCCSSSIRLPRWDWLVTGRALGALQLPRGRVDGRGIGRSATPRARIGRHSLQLGLALRVRRNAR